MSHIIQKFGDWKKLNEQDVPSREKQTGSRGNRVVAIPVDKNTLRLKLIEDADVIGTNSKLTIDGFNGLVEWIKTQPSIINYEGYAGLLDLVTNIVVYSIGKDNARKQVITFKIYSKNDLKQIAGNQSSSINPSVRFIREDEIASALKGVVLNVKAQDITKKPEVALTGLTLPYPISSILNSVDAPLRDLVIRVYNVLIKVSAIGNDPIFKKVRDEASAKKLGKASQSFMVAAIAGLKIVDREFKSEIEADEITQPFINRLAEIEGAPNLLSEFDAAVFLLTVKNVPGAATGGIIVPELGFQYGAAVNPELAKFQQVLLTNLPTYRGGELKKVPAVVAFLKTKADGLFDDITSNLVYLFKTGLSAPKYPDSEKKTILPDFVTRMLKEFGQIKESRTYLGLDGFSLITEDFDLGAAQAAGAAGATTPVASTKPKAKANPAANTPFATASIPLKNKADIKAFQNYVLTTKSDKEILGPSGADGQLGGKTYAAWAKYGAEYQKKAKTGKANPTQATKNKTQFDDILKLLKTNSTSAKAKVTTHSIKGKAQGRFIMVRFTHSRFNKCSISFYEYQDGHSVNTFRIYNQKEGTVDETGAVDSVSGGNVSLRITKGTFKGATFSGPILEVLAKAASSSKASWSYDQ